MLHERYSAKDLNTILIPQAEWQPYPRIQDEDAWAALPQLLRKEYIKCGESFLNHEWPMLPATLFLQYDRNGNRRNYERVHFARRAALCYLIVAECMENQGRFLDDIVNGIWTICEESYWGIPAHMYMQQAGNGLPDTAERTVDLFAAETSALLAWVYYLLDETLDDVSPLIRPRLEREIDERILTPCEDRDDFWWMGFDTTVRGGRRVNNWNPWICSNWLASTLLMEKDEARRQRTVARILTSVDKFIDPYPIDGGCDEGPSYWGRAGASLFDNLDLLYSASDGKIDVYGEPLIQEIGRFIHRVQIDGDYYLNFADAPAMVYPDAMLVYRYGQRIGDAEMVALGQWLAERQGLVEGENLKAEQGSDINKRELPASLSRLLPSLFTLPTLPVDSVAPPLPREVWLPEIEVMVARDQEGSSAGLFVAAKGGHNEESHNHNDIGNFVIYIDGKPVIVDAGVETYTSATFGPNRYDIWTMQSAYHSLLPTIDGIQQQPGPDFKAGYTHHETTGDTTQLTVDIGPAYPPEAQIASWIRHITLSRGHSVVIEDSFQFEDDVYNIELSVVTPSLVDLRQAGKIRFESREILDGRLSGRGVLTYDATIMKATVETIPITDERLGGTWGSELYRVVLSVDQVVEELMDTWRYELTSGN